MRSLMILAGTLLCIGCAATERGSDPAYSSSNENTVNSDQGFTIEVVASDLAVPWSVVFTDEHRMLFSERTGRIREIVDGTLNPIPLMTIANVSTRSEEGLMGLAVDPNYASEPYIYACYAHENGDDLQDRVVRFTDTGTALIDETIVIDGIPAAQYHAGCRLGFGPDGTLYITTGDATDGDIAQNIDSLGGKILRINTDGSIPFDNPFPDSPVWSLGHRNPQGISWDADGNLYETEHGPSGFDGPGGGDEINLIEKGKNYGWPVVSHERTDPRFTDPLKIFTPAEAPGSVLIYTGDVFPQWRNDLFYGALKGEGIWHFDVATDRTTLMNGGKLFTEFGRIREVTQGPDGFIYFSTSNRDGRGNPDATDDKIYRIVPADEASSSS